MILLDFSQVMIGSFMAMGRGSVVVEEDLLRHTVLNTIRNYKLQFKEAYEVRRYCCWVWVIWSGSRNTACHV